MKGKDTHLEHILEELLPLGEITVRRMFGGRALYCNGTVFALMADQELFLKADDLNRPAFVARGMDAFRPFEAQAMTMSYYRLPTAAFDDGDLLRELAREAVQAGQRSATTKRPRQPRRPTKRP